MTVKTQAIFWSCAFIAFFLILWILRPVLMPFALGTVIAYLLNPVVNIMSCGKIPRWLASGLILFVFLLLALAVIALVFPLVYRELSELINNLPDYTDRLVTMAMPYMEAVQERFGDGYMDNFRTFLQNNTGKILKISGDIASNIASGGQALASFATTLALTPVVAFFMMKEWPAITSWVQELYPRQHEITIKDLLKQIDTKISGFIRGQLAVAFVLGGLYALSLALAGLDYGFIIGLGAGALSIIPMLGSTLGLVTAVAVAWFQSGELSFVAIIAAIFIVGQVVEGNLLTPKLVGDSVGLHPLWILFSLMVGGSTFGILGMLLAVPVAAVIGVLLGFAISKYRQSPLYGKKPEQPEKAEKKEKQKKGGKKNG